MMELVAVSESLMEGEIVAIHVSVIVSETVIEYFTDCEMLLELVSVNSGSD